MDKKTKLIIGVSPPRRGKIHDKKQLEKTRWDQKLPTSIGRYGDLGYYGMKGSHWHLPHKKPKSGMLTRWQKTLNKRFAKERIRTFFNHTPCSSESLKLQEIGASGTGVETHQA
ncbi:MAG: hypothetical protein HY007_01190 [Candidatus Sungbacteria bacterium]|nr:hypothetical protein [Candidatus Sungbacteria bacterium]